MRPACVRQSLGTGSVCGSDLCRGVSRHSAATGCWCCAGTHYVEALHLGGSGFVTSIVPATTLQQLLSRGVDVAAAAALDVESSVGCDISGSSDYGAWLQLNSSRRGVEVVGVPAAPPRSSDSSCKDPGQWLRQVAVQGSGDGPAAIQLQLALVSDLLTAAVRSQRAVALSAGFYSTLLASVLLRCSRSSFCVHRS